MMARRYPVPPDTSESEKVFGGWLTWYQVICIGIGIILGVIVFLLFFKIFGKFALIFALPIGFTGVPFAFIKKEELRLADYLYRKARHKKIQKKIPNKRKIN